MSTLPGTAIKLTFIETAPGKYPPLFYQDDPGGGAMASVNAGNSDQLYVGGSGINGGFANVLKALSLTAFEDRHKALLVKALGGGAPIETYTDSDPMSFSLVYPEAYTTKVAGSHDGVCFVDVFAPEHRPAGLVANAAMLYVAPPNGSHYADAPAFLAAIRKTARNIAATMGRYQAVAATHSVPSIPVLRLCLFSSGIYNTLNLNTDDIAEQIFGGLCDVLKGEDCGLTEVQLPIGNLLFDIVQKQALNC